MRNRSKKKPRHLYPWHSLIAFALLWGTTSEAILVDPLLCFRRNADQFARDLEFHPALERLEGDGWARIADQLQQATDSRLRQPFLIRRLGEFQFPLDSAAYRDTRFVVQKNPSPDVPRGAQIYRGAEFGYQLPEDFRRLGRIEYAAVGRDGRVLEIGGGSPELVRELRSHLFGRTLDATELAKIGKINREFFDYLRAQPDGKAQLKAFATAPDRGWPEGLEDEAELAYFDNESTPVIDWARSHGYTLDEMRDAGWLLLKFDPDGRPRYEVNAPHSIKIPFFADGDRKSIPVWRSRDLGPARKDRPKYIGWQIDRSINRVLRPFERLYNGWELKHAKDKTVIITEGEFKSMVTQKTTGIVTVGIPGITEFDGSIVDALVRAEAREYIVVLDRDPRGKAMMRTNEVTDSERAAYALATDLQRAGARSVRIGILPDVEEGDKIGIDDLILKYGPGTIRPLLAEARDPDRYALEMGLSPVFMEIVRRRQALTKALQRYETARLRGGSAVPERVLQKGRRMRKELDRLYYGYLESRYDGARSLAEPSAFRSSLGPIARIPDEIGKAIRTAQGHELNLRTFEGPILLFDHVTIDEDPLACAGAGAGCEQIPFSRAAVLDAFQGGKGDLNLQADLAKGQELARKDGFVSNTLEGFASILLAGHLTRTFPSSDFQYRFNVELAGTHSTQAPIVIFSKKSGSAVALAALRANGSPDSGGGLAESVRFLRYRNPLATRPDPSEPPFADQADDSDDPEREASKAISLAKTYPEAQIEFESLKEKLAMDPKAFIASRKDDVRFQDVLDYSHAKRSSAASALHGLALRHAQDPRVSALFENAASSIEFRKDTAERTARKMSSLGQLTPRSEQWLSAMNEVDSYTAKVNGTLAEVSVALSVPGLYAAGVTMGALPPIRAATTGLSRRAANAEVLHAFGDQQALSGKEVDVLFKGGRAWGEVKYFTGVLSSGTAMDSLVAQLDQDREVMAKLRQGVLVNGQLVRIPVEELHVFIVNGITQAQARKLEHKGIIVHGNIVN